RRADGASGERNRRVQSGFFLTHWKDEQNYASHWITAERHPSRPDGACVLGRSLLRANNWHGKPRRIYPRLLRRYHERFRAEDGSSEEVGDTARNSWSSTAPVPAGEASRPVAGMRRDLSAGHRSRLC